jgi:methionyl-tRNA formyltransferase
MAPIIRYVVTRAYNALMRSLFFGLPAGVSTLVLHGLMNDGRDVVGVVLPASAVPHLLPDPVPPLARLSPPAGPALPLGQPADLLSLAWERGLPVLAVGDFGHGAALDALAAFAPDVAVVACFTRRIPPAALAVPRLGFLNLHPSLLPAYRGPQPLFWQLRDGAMTGATVHYMDDGLDTGDIAAQMSVPLPDGISGPEAERTLALAGLGLLRGVLDELARGVATRWPQGPGGSTQRAPTGADFALSTLWSARRAFNFMRGTADWGQPYPVEVNGRTEWLAAAEEWRDVALDRPSVRHGRHIIIRFAAGVLYAIKTS